ncbi:MULTISPECIES: hypothetical protein [Pseudomonas]|uniref:Uncharacterized protein n=1 Tax=Pseudomonas nitroreducens TaxID=46680 RepID=A0A6G6J804_PSENT|nr:MULTISPECIES: hypothetical protein [Pseudomonas]MDU4255615.1 hypothetical protein [Pseudomonas sp.]QIE91402.1 hypothetical protein G5B91_34230 [Pseudomonas nitroreducens]HBO6301712.1 hypothetical protein [Pseudomonas aeruginosa]
MLNSSVPPPHSPFLEGRLQITVQSTVIGCRWFMADGKRVATVTVIGNEDGPMGAGMQCKPRPIFELDAEYSVFEELADRLNPPEAAGEPTFIRAKFLADLKPISLGGRYVTHLLKVLSDE